MTVKQRKYGCDEVWLDQAVYEYPDDPLLSWVESGSLVTWEVGSRRKRQYVSRLAIAALQRRQAATRSILAAR